MKLIENSCDGRYTSVDVRFTKKCDNNCSFCIEKTGVDSFGNTNVEKLIKSTIDTGIKDVLVLGGEPFLFPEKLHRYILGIREYVKTIYVTTSLPYTFIKKSDICDNILDIIDGLNVSIQDIDWVNNNEILNASVKYDRLSVLEKLNMKYSDKIRTSINLIKGGVDTKYKLMETLKYFENIGCKYIKINELQNSESYVSYEDIMSIKLKSPYANGCNTHITINNVPMKILLKRSCFLVENSKDANFADFTKIVIKTLIYRVIKYKNNFKVLYEDGTVKNNWLKNN